MKITIELPDSLVKRTVRGIMENFPEASNGCALKCVRYDYDKCLYWFVDTEDKSDGPETVHTLTEEKLMAAFPLLFSEHWTRGLTQPPISADPTVWGDWLCQADAQDFDAFAQLACFGKTIYG